MTILGRFFGRCAQRKDAGSEALGGAELEKVVAKCTPEVYITFQRMTCTSDQSDFWSQPLLTKVVTKRCTSGARNGIRVGREQAADEYRQASRRFSYCSVYL